MQVIGDAAVVQPQQVQHRGVQVGDHHSVFDGVVAQVIGRAIGLPAADAAVPRDLRQLPKPRKGTVSEHRRDERERIIEALRACNWNRVKAAELSGIPRRTFYRRLREYGIQ